MSLDQAEYDAAVIGRANNIATLVSSLPADDVSTAALLLLFVRAALASGSSPNRIVEWTREMTTAVVSIR